MLRNSFLLIFLFLFLSHRTYSELLPLYGLFLLRHCILKYVTVQSQPPKCYAFRRCGVSVKWIFTQKCSVMQACLTLLHENPLGSERLLKYTYFLPASSYIYCKHSSQNRRLHAP